MLVACIDTMAIHAGQDVTVGLAVSVVGELALTAPDNKLAPLPKTTPHGPCRAGLVPSQRTVPDPAGHL